MLVPVSQFILGMVDPRKEEKQGSETEREETKQGRRKKERRVQYPYMEKAIMET